MDIIDSYKPINSKEKVDELVVALSRQGKITPAFRLRVIEAISKVKIQMYFNEKYPESFFADSSNNNIQQSEDTQKKGTAQTTSSAQASRTTNNTPSPGTEDMQMVLPEQTLGSKKYIWGTYIEMAFHNFFVNMRHIYTMVFGEDIMDYARNHYVPRDPRYPNWNEDFATESLVWTPMFIHLRKGTTDGDPNHSNPENIEKARELIERHFPLLKPATEFTRNNNNYRRLDQIEILKRLSQVLRVLRNVYSHYSITLFDNQIAIFNNNQNLIAGILGMAFLDGKCIVKQRFAFDDAAMQCTEQYDKSHRDERGRPMKVKRERSGFHYRLTQRDSDHLTEFGLAFLCSLFLEKKYSKILTDKVRCIPFAEQSVVNELIAVFRIRLHQEKLYVSKNTDAVAFDILTELRRCPKELFDQIRPEAQQQFRITSTEEETDGVLMVRKQDRFAHLVMKYIDDAKLFDSIRFQVSLGKYFYKFYDKYCIDNANEPRVRSLNKPVNGFGRISEIDQLRAKRWEESIRKFEDVHKNTADESPYVTDHHAQYVINGNRIAMRIFTESPMSYLPELTPEGATNLPPTCWMSIYELPAMMFLIHLRGASVVEEKIKSTVANYNKLFNDVAEGVLHPQESKEQLQDVLNADYNGMRIADIPADMVDYLTGSSSKYRQSLNEHARGLIETLIDQTKYKIERFHELCKQERNPKMNKFGKKNYVRIMPGKLADFLAKDMMMFQPNDDDNRGRLTGLNFSILQSVLAQYGNEAFDEAYLHRTLTSAHIIGNNGDDRCNPVMQRVWKRYRRPHNTRDLYKAYLEERLAYLQECKQQDIAKLPFIKSNRLRWQDHDDEFYKAKAARYLHETSNNAEYDKALELPRGMFDTLIREELSTIEPMAADAGDEKKNIAYLIYGYFKKAMLDDVQPYYEAERTYSVLNHLYKKSPRDAKVYYDGQKIRESLMRSSGLSLHKAIGIYVDGLRQHERADEKDHLQRLLKNMKENENTLKRYRIQDIILFMIAMKILMADENDVERLKALDKIRLKDITDKDVLSQKVRFEVEVVSKNGLTKRITQNDLKIKDYARFYRFVSDRRMPSLLNHIRTYHVDKDLIDKELSGYDKVHPTILEEVFRYEKDYLEKHGETTDKEFSRMINNDDGYDFQVKKRLGVIRNSFAHCSYPPCQNIGNEAQSKNLPEKAIAISETFKNDIKKDED